MLQQHRNWKPFQNSLPCNLKAASAAFLEQEARYESGELGRQHLQWNGEAFIDVATGLKVEGVTGSQFAGTTLLFDLMQHPTLTFITSMVKYVCKQR